MSGERGDVDIESVQEWKDILAELCKGYDPDTIFNMDETGLFLRTPPSQLIFQNVKIEPVRNGQRKG